MISILNRHRIARALEPASRRFRYFLYNIRDIFDLFLLCSRNTKITPYGFSITGSSSIHHKRMQEGTFETDEVKLLISLLADTDVFVDVGANIGYFTCLARSLKKKVVTIEPLAQNLHYLYRNLYGNPGPDVDIFPVGLSEKPGVARLFGASSTGASLLQKWAGASQRISRLIPISTLDNVLGDRFTGQKLIIKVDVEGVEKAVLSGATKILRMTPRPIWLIEVCLNEFHPTGVNPDFLATFETFWNLGYEVTLAGPNKRKVSREDVMRWVRTQRTDGEGINYLCY